MHDKVLRIDKFSLHSDKAQVTPQGYLLADAYATRVGVFNYLMGDGSVFRELRPAEEVFHPDSLASLAMVPLTDDHPPVQLDAKNTEQFIVGYTGQEVKQEGDYLALKINVTKKKVIEGIVSKQKDQLSCGYLCDIVPESGTWNGQAYDAIQRNIRYNHLAIVKEGRAGPMARVRMDSRSALQIDETEKKDELLKIGSSQDLSSPLSSEKKGVIPMAKIKIDGVEYEISDAVAPLVSAKLTKNDELEAALKAEKAEKDRLAGKCDGLESELKQARDELKKKADSAPSQKELLQIAKARMALEDIAKKASVDEAKIDSMSDIEVKKEVVAKARPNLSLDGKTDGYIEGVFDTVKESIVNSDSEEVGKLVVNSDGVTNAVEAARAKYIERSKNAWKTKTN